MRRYAHRLFIASILLASVVFITTLWAGISSTKHNLSTSGPGSVKATSEKEICLFCHTPHNAAKTPLWNRDDPGQNYTLYTSSTLDATIGQPDGTSLMCLSCHDGTIALGKVKSRTNTIDMGSNTYMPSSSNAYIGTDLRDDHPISFNYDAALASADGQLKNPSSINSKLVLENGKMQCSSCHDAHDDTYNDFLRLSSEQSALCQGCHSRTGWSNSTHYTSTSTWNGSGTDPWFHTPSSYNTVQKNACENCHNPHNADRAKMNLNFSNEEDNCLVCHNSNVAQEDIDSELNKSYKHNVANYLNVHDPTENNLVSSKHVECTDCHNPHRTNSTTASAPNVSGRLTGVSGIDGSGNSVTSSSYEYQICYKCHSSSSWRPASRITRDIEQNNVRLEFDTGNPSYHPVEGSGASTDVPSLIDLTTNSVIYCTDCHSSNGTNAPNGPHGSAYVPILKLNYSTADYTTESATAYALCYSCHSRTSILSDVTFSEHDEHVVEEDTPCSVCHDAHGISSTQGNTTNNTRLINFDMDVVSQGMRDLFTDTGYRQGRCSLRCHGQRHGNWNYP